MTSLPRITIITPSYNQGEFIEQTIRSVLDQGYPDLEYIVMDGGSTDQTISILRKYEGQLYWISEKDRGQSHAINKGLKMASGEVVAFLNSDDLYEPGALRAVGEFFARYPEAAWVTGKCRIIDQHGREVRKAITLYKNLWLHLRRYEVLLVLNYISQPATFWRRQVVNEVGFLIETPYYTMDYEYWLRIGQRFRLWFINRYLACFRIHPASKSGSSAQAQFDEELEAVQRYTRSPLLIGLHRLHSSITVAVYKRLLARERARYLSFSEAGGE